MQSGSHTCRPSYSHHNVQVGDALTAQAAQARADVELIPAEEKRKPVLKNFFSTNSYTEKGTLVFIGQHSGSKNLLCDI